MTRKVEPEFMVWRISRELYIHDLEGQNNIQRSKRNNKDKKLSFVRWHMKNNSYLSVEIRDWVSLSHPITIDFRYHFEAISGLRSHSKEQQAQYLLFHPL